MVTRAGLAQHRDEMRRGRPRIGICYFGDELATPSVSGTVPLNMLMTGAWQGTIARGIERHHAAIAYARAAGNLDIDLAATSATMVPVA